MIESSLCDSISESRIGIKCFNYFRVSSFDDFLKEVIQVESSAWGGCFGASAAWDLRCPPRLPLPPPYRRLLAAYVVTAPPKVCPISPLSWPACLSILNRPTLLLLQLWLAQKKKQTTIPTLTLPWFQLEILTNMADNADTTASLFISGKDSSSLPLPPELLSKIFGYIPYSDLKNALLVCR